MDNPNFNPFDLTQKVIIITGGAGLLGREYAHAIARMGGTPILADLNIDATRAAAQNIFDQTGCAAVAIPTDVTRKESVTSLIQETVSRFGRIDGLVNNAALDPKFDTSHGQQHTNSFEDYPLELWNQSLAVNVTGMFLCAQAVAPVMLKQNQGVIVNVSSMYGLVGPDQRLYERDDPDAPRSFKPVQYTVTKSAVLGLTHYLAAYYAGKGIRVNTLTPGGVFNGHDDEFLRRYNARSILGRMADKNEMCGPLLFLLSDASSYMTGANLVVDGGWTAW
ncbi:MAG: SDR family oxidoreductase [Anaerolineae bacterium]|nr:SDR family oxidoreductase [Anaerolineae bacterium]